MKNAIRTNILVLAALPFLLIFIGIFLFAVNGVFRHEVHSVELRVRNLARFNEVTFRSYINNTLLSVQAAAVELQNINPASQNARKQGENIILALFNNHQVNNVWLAFEPNAFDGGDSGYQEEYPGITSGRYIRSYFRRQNGDAVIDDIDETILTYPAESRWYHEPMDRGQPCLNISGGYVFRDYRGEAENTNLVTMVVPVFRNGQVIGCVGEGLLIDKIILGEDIIPRAVSALFLGNGILRYSGNSAYAGNSLEQMGFANHRLIMEALSRGKELFLSDTPSPLLGERAYAFFLPVYLRDFNELVYIYTALPRDVISEAIAPVLRPIIICAIIALASFFALLFYFYETLAKPIRGLTLAGEAIARGDLNREIIVSKSNDEIGVMSRSLRDMVEQFRMYIALEEQSTKLLELHMRIQNALYTSDTLNDAFDSIAPIICDALDAYKGSIIILIKGMPRIRVVYRTAAGPEDSGQDMDFKYHNHVASLLSGRKYLLCNAGGISENKIEFTDEDTTALCVIPILIEGSLRGYILLEGRGESGLSVHDDSTLCFIADTIAYILARRGISEEPIRLRDDTRTGELDQRDSIA